MLIMLMVLVVWEERTSRGKRGVYLGGDENGGVGVNEGDDVG